MCLRRFGKPNPVKTMSSWLVRNTERGNEREVESRAEAEETKQNLISIGASPDNLEIVPPDKASDGGTEAKQPEVVEDKQQPEKTPPQPAQDDIDQLVQNPIDWLREKNDEYVNVVKGTPAISKRGFRYIQSKFEISTESEVVQWVDDPTGVIVWAKAELPDGRSAEAHGEGWLFESSVDDNEFVRYADTRAKNRALSDLTSSGALATEELK